jgi:hypothetical protein
LTGVITDPRELGIPYPKVKFPKKHILNKQMLIPPLPEKQAVRVEIVKGPNIHTLPPTDLLPDRLEMPILLKVGDNISTDEIMPAGARVLPYRSNIPRSVNLCLKTSTRPMLSAPSHGLLPVAMPSSPVTITVRDRAANMRPSRRDIWAYAWSSPRVSLASTA